MVKNNHRDRCPICGSREKNVYIPLCTECYPPLYKKGSYPHQKLRRRKIWKEKRTQKLNEVGNKCEWCQRSDRILSIHHPKGVDSQTYREIWFKLLNEKLDNFINEDKNRLTYANIYLQFKAKRNLIHSKKYFENQARYEFVQCCPKCGSSSYSKRSSTSTLNYKCYQCNARFSKLSTRAHLNTLEKIKSLDQLIRNSEKINPEAMSTVHRINKIVLNGFIQRLMPIFFEDLRIKYEQEVKKLITSYLDFDMTLVLCKNCHIATARGLNLCKVCNDGYHTKKYDRCSTCREKKIEETDPTARFLRKYFDLSLWDQYDRSMECECLKCGGPTFDNIDEYVVYITEEDKEKEGWIGEFCETCFQEYQMQEKKEYFVTKLI